MDSTHTALEILECLSIVLITGGLLLLMRRVNEQVRLVARIPELLDQLALRENDKIEELLVSQAVVLRRLKEIERRLTHGSH